MRRCDVVCGAAFFAEVVGPECYPFAADEVPEGNVIDREAAVGEEGDRDTELYLGISFEGRAGDVNDDVAVRRRGDAGRFGVDGYGTAGAWGKGDAGDAGCGAEAGLTGCADRAAVG